MTASKHFVVNSTSETALAFTREVIEILTGREFPVEVRSNLPAPAATNGETIWIDQQALYLLANDIDSGDLDLAIPALSKLRGLLYHEVSHCLWTFRARTDFWKTCVANGHKAAANILEDQRIEALLTARFSVRRYLTYTVTEFILSNHNRSLENVYPLLYGRRYLPTNIRRLARDAYRNQEALTDIERIIDEFVLLRFPRDTQRGLDLVAEFDALLSYDVRNAEPKHEIDKGQPENPERWQTQTIEQTIEDDDIHDPEDGDEGDTPEVTSAGQPGEGVKDEDAIEGNALDGAASEGESDDDGEGTGNDGGAQGADGEDGGTDADEDGAGSGEGESGSIDSTESADTTETSGGQGAGGKRERPLVDQHDKEIERALREALKDERNASVDEKDESIRREAENDLRSFSRLRNVPGPSTALRNENGLASTESVPGALAAVPTLVAKPIRKLIDSLGAKVLHGQTHGDIDTLKYRTRRPGDDFRVFTRAQRDQRDVTSFEVVVLLDRSYSTVAAKALPGLGLEGADGVKNVAYVSSLAAWAVKRACDTLPNTDCTVLAFDDDQDHVDLYGDDKADPIEFQYAYPSGGTDPLSALYEAARIFQRSKRANKLLLVITDGAFNPGVLVESDALIERFNQCGAVTALVGVGHAEADVVARWGNHGCDFSRDLDSPLDLPLYFRDIVQSRLIQNAARAAKRKSA